METNRAEPGAPERAYLIAGSVRGPASTFTPEESLDELAQLAATAGLTVVGRDIQHLVSVNPATYIGSGKVEELEALRRELDFSVLIFDDELSPAQLRTLEDRIQARIVDRTALILDIFALHARSREGALQVELAQYAYRLPRLTRMWTHLSRQAVGGVGLRGPGETQLEIDRREISRRMTQLRRELDQVRQQRGLQRRRRRRAGLPVIAIVGYTNAGKSTLLNRISGSAVLVQDQLFATLDPTTRRVVLPSGKEALFTDTVGFIQKLPTQLVAAFRATLEEVRDADILMHVVDVSDAHMLSKVDAVRHVLAEIEAGDKPALVALNKVDLVDPETELEPGGGGRFAMRESRLQALRHEFGRVVPVSAQQGVGIAELLSAVEDSLAEQMAEADVLLPYDSGEALNLWHKQGIIEDISYGEEGIHVRGRLPKWLLGSLTEPHEAPSEE